MPDHNPSPMKRQSTWKRLKRSGECRKLEPTSKRSRNDRASTSSQNDISLKFKSVLPRVVTYLRLNERFSIIAVSRDIHSDIRNLFESICKRCHISSSTHDGAWSYADKIFNEFFECASHSSTDWAILVGRLISCVFSLDIPSVVAQAIVCACSQYWQRHFVLPQEWRTDVCVLGKLPLTDLPMVESQVCTLLRVCCKNRSMRDRSLIASHFIGSKTLSILKKPQKEVKSLYSNFLLSNIEEEGFALNGRVCAILVGKEIEEDSMDIGQLFGWIAIHHNEGFLLTSSKKQNNNNLLKEDIHLKPKFIKNTNHLSNGPDFALAALYAYSGPSIGRISQLVAEARKSASKETTKRLSKLSNEISKKSDKIGNTKNNTIDENTKYSHNTKKHCRGKSTKSTKSTTKRKRLITKKSTKFGRDSVSNFQSDDESSENEWRCNIKGLLPGKTKSCASFVEMENYHLNCPNWILSRENICYDISPIVSKKLKTIFEIQKLLRPLASVLEGWALGPLFWSDIEHEIVCDTFGKMSNVKNKKKKNKKKKKIEKKTKTDVLTKEKNVDTENNRQSNVSKKLEHSLGTEFSTTQKNEIQKEKKKKLERSKKYFSNSIKKWHSRDKKASAWRLWVLLCAVTNLWDDDFADMLIQSLLPRTQSLLSSYYFSKPSATSCLTSSRREMNNAIKRSFVRAFG